MPNSNKIHHSLGIVTVISILTIFIIWPLYSKPDLTLLDKIKQRNEIRFITYNSPSTLIEDENGKDGFEYQLAQGFAEHIGVKASFKTVQNYKDIENQIIFKDADIAAAGLNELNSNNPLIQFGPKYYQATPQVIYKKGNQRFKTVESFADTPLDIVENNGSLELLRQLAAIDGSQLNWQVLQDIGDEEAIEMVNEGLIQYLLVDSHKFALQRRFYPELRISFELKQKKPLKWMLKSTSDSSLIDAVHDYFQQIKEDGRLQQWVHRYLSHVEKFNYSDIQTFRRLLNDRLPSFQHLFIKEAKANQLDWRLLAAIGYQESLWNPKAKSPTGVRGLMMLTRITAKQMKIANRLDPAQSIKGGAKYFKTVMRKIPKRIKQPDKTWMALASYNVGYGHLEDARKITEQRGGDPDKWIDLKESLPLLSRKKWYKKTKYGYARGAEPVKYVENIRKYFELIKWHSEQNIISSDFVIEPKKAEPKSSVLNASPSL